MSKTGRSHRKNRRKSHQPKVNTDRFAEQIRKLKQTMSPSEISKFKKMKSFVDAFQEFKGPGTDPILEEFKKEFPSTNFGSTKSKYRNCHIGQIHSSLCPKLKAKMYVELLCDNTRRCVLGGEAATWASGRWGHQDSRQVLMNCTANDLEAMSALSGLTQIAGLALKDVVEGNLSYKGDIDLVIEAFETDPSSVGRLCRWFAKTPFLSREKPSHLWGHYYNAPINPPQSGIDYARIMDQAGMRLCVQLAHHAPSEFLDSWADAKSFRYFLVRMEELASRFGDDVINQAELPLQAIVILSKLCFRSAKILAVFSSQVKKGPGLENFKKGLRRFLSDAPMQLNMYGIFLAKAIGIPQPNSTKENDRPQVEMDIGRSNDAKKKCSKSSFSKPSKPCRKKPGARSRKKASNQRSQKPDGKLDPVQNLGDETRTCPWDMAWFQMVTDMVESQVDWFPGMRWDGWRQSDIARFVREGHQSANKLHIFRLPHILFCLSQLSGSERWAVLDGALKAEAELWRERGKPRRLSRFRMLELVRRLRIMLNEPSLETFSSYILAMVCTAVAPEGHPCRQVASSLDLKIARTSLGEHSTSPEVKVIIEAADHLYDYKLQRKRVTTEDVSKSAQYSHTLGFTIILLFSKMPRKDGVNFSKQYSRFLIGIPALTDTRFKKFDPANTWRNLKATIPAYLFELQQRLEPRDHTPFSSSSVQRPILPSQATRWKGCQLCGDPAGIKLRCGRCKKVTYCNAICQHIDWKEHKKSCARSTSSSSSS